MLDAGALIALDRDVRPVWALLRVAVDRKDTVLVPSGVIGQAWRNGARQARLARALKHCEELTLDGAAARAAGLLCGRAGTVDVIDASVAVAAATAARRAPASILTSDPGDMERLTAFVDGIVRIVEV